MGVLVGSAVVPISLAMFWTRLNGVGMVGGAVSGLCLGIIAWLGKAAVNPGGLSKEMFFKNTGKLHTNPPDVDSMKKVFIGRSSKLCQFALCLPSLLWE
jgi:Na+(H+)/acetate symporter ActP